MQITQERDCGRTWWELWVSAAEVVGFRSQPDDGYKNKHFNGAG